MKLVLHICVPLFASLNTAGCVFKSKASRNVVRAHESNSTVFNVTSTADEKVTPIPEIHITNSASPSDSVGANSVPVASSVTKVDGATEKSIAVKPPVVDSDTARPQSGDAPASEKPISVHHGV